MAAHAAAEAGRLRLTDPLELVSSFRSLADANACSLAAEDDSDPALYGCIGSSIPAEELLDHRMVYGSNLAANVLLDPLRPERVTACMAELGAPGFIVRRGLQDLRVYALGHNNGTTARSLRTVLGRVARGETASPQASQAILERTLREPGGDGLRALLPSATLVAHKSGRTETLFHDAGIVLPTERAPFAAVILNEGFAHVDEARAFVAEASLALFQAL